jgi:tetratricopeptide (TPR) repeat protein
MNKAHLRNLSCNHKHPGNLAGGTPMFRKYFPLSLAGLALLLTLTASASAQTGALRGHVKFKQADGTVVPAVGAIVDVVRIDLSGKYEGKTDKRGEFVWAGLPYVGDYIIGVSMPNAQPSYQGGVKVGRDVDYQIELSPGDGHRLTVDELKQFAKGGGGGGGGGSSSSKGSGESVEDKAKREELLKKNAEIIEKNKKIEEANAVLNRTFTAGNEAFKAGNFDEAIKQYDEGLTADSEQSGFWTNKSRALKARGVNKYNAAVKLQGDAKNQGLDAARADFKASVESANKAVELMKAEPAATDPAEQTRRAGNKLATLESRAESYRLFVTKADPSQADAGLAAYEEYIAVETDPVKKAKALATSAQMLLDAGAGDKAFAQFQKILADKPDDPDANLGAGLALYSTGDKVKYQQAANYLQHFVDTAPDGRKDKEEIKGVLAELKNTENVIPEKIAPAPRRKRP